MIAEKEADRGKTNFALKCVADHYVGWRCDAEIEVRHYRADIINFTVECKEVTTVLPSF